jgi:hypothetical protein
LSGSAAESEASTNVSITLDLSDTNRVKDAKRLADQHARVLSVMVDGQWRTLAEIAKAAQAPEASVSARLRDFRKPEFGGHEVQRRRRGGRGGTFEYRLVIGI